MATISGILRVLAPALFLVSLVVLVASLVRTPKKKVFLRSGCLLLAAGIVGPFLVGG